MNDNGQLKGVDEEALDFYQNNYLPTLSYVQKQDNDGSYKVVSLITHNAEKGLIQPNGTDKRFNFNAYAWTFEK